jgi:pimeloyl-ACP methyl ester carboxylesterase
MAALSVLIALLCTGALYQVIGARRDRHAPPGALVDLGGHRVHVVCRGQGKPAVLFESGVAASSLSWVLVQPEVAKFTRVCTYDRAGLAWSDTPSSPRTFNRITDEMAAVLAYAGGHGRHVLVGHSFGSLVVRAYAALHPENVAAVVMVDPPTDWLTGNPRRAYLLRRGVRLSRVGAVLARLGIVRASLALLTGGAPGAPRRLVKVFGPTASGTLERLVGEVRKLPPEVHPMVKAHWSQPKCFTAMADYIGAFLRDKSAMAALTPPADIPLVVISGGNQPPETLASQRQLVERSLGGRQVIARGSAHWVMFDEPDLIVGIVRELVDRARSAPLR